MKVMQTILVIAILASVSVLVSGDKDKARDSISLDAAVAKLQKQMRERDKEPFIALVSKDTVTKAIKSAIASYDLKLKNDNRKNVNWEEAYKPIYENIVKTGYVPEGVSLHAIPAMIDLGKDGTELSYEGVWVRLDIPMLSDYKLGFALPILDVAYGRFH